VEKEDSLLAVNDLRTYFFTRRGVVKAVDGINLDVKRGECLGVVGESGSGKTVTALSVLRLVPHPGRIVSGNIRLEGKDLVTMSDAEMQHIRGAKIAVVFQDPQTSLDPLYSVGDQIAEIIHCHTNLDNDEIEARTVELFGEVGIAEAEVRRDQYPHQLSGGMKQRIAIARALACRPTLLFADEPTTSLDVTTQLQVLELLRKLRRTFAMSLVLITHNMGVIADMSERVVVMYAGNICEVGDTVSLFEKPGHPYTKALLTAVPRIDRKEALDAIPGTLPDMIDPPSGCRFHPRCKHASEICATDAARMEQMERDHFVSCHRWRAISP
jgi:peptide/nickel transport system ATP-binding protein/oligopeptide transport system ATP-binding protein